MNPPETQPPKQKRRKMKSSAAKYELAVTCPNTFVPTRALKKAEELLENRGIVVLIGSPGSGKTTLGLNLLKYMRDLHDRQPRILTHHSQFEDLPVPSDWRNIMEHEKLVVLIDDMFGKSNLVIEFQQAWEMKYPQMWRRVQFGMIKLVITVRSQIFSECKENLSEVSVFKNCYQIDLHGPDLCLTSGEKYNILDQHLNSSKDLSSTLTDKEKQYAASLTFTELGFPQCCSFYVNSPEAQTRGLDYFNKPIEFLKGEFDRIREDRDRQYQYLVLLVVMFKQGTLLEDSLDAFEVDTDTINLIRTLTGVCRINTDVSLGEIKVTAKFLCGVYLEYHEVNRAYSFIHQSVFDTLFLQFSSNYPKKSIEICPVPILLEYITTVGVPQKGGLTVVVEYDNYPVLARRFTEILKSHQARYILSHKSFKDENFVKFLTDVFWDNKVPDEILSQKLDIVKHTVILLFHETNVDALFEDVEFLKLSGLSMSHHYEPWDKQTIALSSSPGSVAVFQNLETLSACIVHSLVKENFSEAKPQTKEILDIACFAGDHEVVDILLKSGITPTLSSFSAAAASQTDDVNIFETLLQHSTPLELGLRELGSMLFLALERENGTLCSMIIDRLAEMTNSDHILQRAVKQLLLQCQKDIRNLDQFKYEANKPTSSVAIGAGHLFKKLFRYSVSMKPEIIVYLAAGLEDAAVLKEILHSNPSWLDTMKKMKTPLHSASRYGCVESVSLLLVQGCSISAVNMYNQTALHLATEYDTCDVALCLLSEGADPNVQDINQNTPLHLACQEGSLQVVKALVEKGANQKTQNASGKTPLHIAAQNGSLEILTYLIDKGAEVNVPDIRGMTPIHLAASLSTAAHCVRHLVDKGSDVNLPDHNGMTPLHLAAQKHESDVSLYLLHKGADPCLTDAEKNTALHMAVLSGSLSLVKELLKRGIKVNATDGAGNIPLHLAAENNLLHIVKYLVDKGSEINRFNAYSNTPLHLSDHDLRGDKREVSLYLISKGADVNLIGDAGKPCVHLSLISETFEFTKALFENGANVNATDTWGITLLHLAIQGSSPMSIIKYLIDNGCKVNTWYQDVTPLHLAIASKRFNVCLYLLKNGADPNDTDSEQNSPLHLAAREKYVDVLEALVKKGAKVNAVNKFGSTALHIATESHSMECVKFLVENGSTVNLQNRSGTIPFHTAVRNNNSDIALYLLNKGADHNVTDSPSWLPLHLAVKSCCLELAKALVDKGSKLNATDESAATPLHIAVQHGPLETIRYLVGKGSRINQPNNKGMTPLHVVALRDKTYEDTTAVCLYLLQNRADPNVPDAGMNCPLHLAVREGRRYVVKTLTERGANVNVEDKSGDSPLHIAASHCSLPIVSILVEKGCLINKQNNAGLTPLHLAARDNSLDVLNHLLNCGADPEVLDHKLNTPLHLAANNTSVDLAKTLLENGASIDSENKMGFTPIHLAMVKGSLECVICMVTRGAKVNFSPNMKISHFVEKLFLSHPDTFSYVLDHGYLPRATTFEKATVYLLVNNGCHSLAKKLVEKGVSLNVTAANGDTPLHVAINACSHRVGERPASVKCILYLLEQGDMVNVANKDGITPLHLAVEHDMPEVCARLLQKGAHSNETDQRKRSPLHIAARCGSLDICKCLAERGANVNAADAVGKRPLHKAVERDSIKVVKYLVEQGSEINAADDRGVTPLHLATGCESSDVLMYLLFSGAKPDVLDADTKSPLFLAVEQGLLDFVNILVVRGAKLDVVDESGNTPLHCAARRGSLELSRIC